MAQTLAAMLQDVVDRELRLLEGITEEASSKSDPGKWSKKEELGHLLDSAVNNHVRIVKATLDGAFEGPGYDQMRWVDLTGYREMPWETLVASWRLHNLVLAHLIGRVPEERLEATCVIGANPPATLGFVIEDYVLHMQHHLDHILGRETVRQYPGAALPA